MSYMLVVFMHKSERGMGGPHAYGFHTQRKDVREKDVIIWP